MFIDRDEGKNRMLLGPCTNMQILDLIFCFHRMIFNLHLTFCDAIIESMHAKEYSNLKLSISTTPHLRYEVQKCHFFDIALKMLRVKFE